MPRSLVNEIERCWVEPGAGEFALLHRPDVMNFLFEIVRTSGTNFFGLSRSERVSGFKLKN